MSSRRDVLTDEGGTSSFPLADEGGTGVVSSRRDVAAEEGGSRL